MVSIYVYSLVQGDEVYVYAYTGTWTADWPYNHFTQFIGNVIRENKYKLSVNSGEKTTRLKTN